ncbi:MAG: hypothetical protein ABEI52_09550 [Halobacteriaceae archaeon]
MTSDDLPFETPTEFRVNLSSDAHPAKNADAVLSGLRDLMMAGANRAFAADCERKALSGVAVAVELDRRRTRREFKPPVDPAKMLEGSPVEPADGVISEAIDVLQQADSQGEHARTLRETIKELDARITGGGTNA